MATSAASPPPDALAATLATAPGAAMELGNFRLVAPLGRGGMGEVWRAEHRHVGAKVAVKLLSPELSDDPAQVQRLFDEARAAGHIQHPGVVKIFDVGLIADRAFLMMELLHGEPLAHRIRRQGRLPIAEALTIAAQIASVLDATHRAGIVHRDIKPDNVFLVPDGRAYGGEQVRILDFGIAKLAGTLAARSRRTFGTLGTPAYMAPEQWSDASTVDHRADLYALGCVVFEMVCGRLPFVAQSLAEACARHLYEEAPRARTIAPDVPLALDDLLAALLAKEPTARPASARDVERALAAITTSPGLDALAPTHAGAPTRPPPRWRSIAALTVVGVATTLTALGASRDNEPPPRTATAAARTVDLPIARGPAAAPPPSALTATGAMLATSTARSALRATTAASSRPRTPNSASTKTRRSPHRAPAASTHEVQRATTAREVSRASDVVAAPDERATAVSSRPSELDVRAVLKPRLAAVARCATPDAPDAIDIELLIMPSGRLARATPLGTQAHTALGQCVSHALISATFPVSVQGALVQFEIGLR